MEYGILYRARTIRGRLLWKGLLNLCISDGEFEVCGSAVIIVQPVNDAPYFTSSFEQELGLNVEFDILISADDVDSDSLTISMVSDFEYPSWFEIQNNHVTGTPLNLGEFNLPLILSDGELTVEENFIFTVYNFIPEITNIIMFLMIRGRVYLSFNASHFDNGESSEQMYSVFRYDYFEDGSSGWVGVQSIVAAGDESYIYEIQTAIDSTSESDGITDFKVVASMSGGVFHSDIMSGYSVDNIAPGIPQDFMVSTAEDGIMLSWDQLRMLISNTLF